MPVGYILEVDELILDKWEKANKGDLTALRVKKSIGNAKRDLKAWGIVQDNYLKVIGLSKHYKKYLMLLLKKSQADLKYLRSEVLRDNILIRDRKLLIPIMILEAKIRKFRLQGGEPLTISQALVKMSKVHGSWLSKKKLTVVDYNELLNEYSNGSN